MQWTLLRRSRIALDNSFIRGDEQDVVRSQYLAEVFGHMAGVAGSVGKVKDGAVPELNQVPEQEVRALLAHLDNPALQLVLIGLLLLNAQQLHNQKPDSLPVGFRRAFAELHVGVELQQAPLQQTLFELGQIFLLVFN
jgi:hypothetical protein